MDIINELNKEWVNIREGRSTLESCFPQALMTNEIKKKSFSFHEERYAEKIIKPLRADIIVGVRMSEDQFKGTKQKKGTLNFKINGELIGTVELGGFQCTGIPGLKSMISCMWFTHQSMEIEVENWDGHVSIIYAVLWSHNHARAKIASLMNTIAIPLEDETKVLVKNGDIFQKIDITDNKKTLLPELPLREPDDVYSEISYRNGHTYGRYKMSEKK